MSLVLGPIHYKVYNNILIHDKIAKLLAEDSNCDCELKSFAKDIEQGELSELIGEEAIHGWLAERVDRADRRVSGVIRHCYSGEMSEKALNAVYDFGKQIGDEYSKDENIMEVFMRIRFNTLDGMPCDGGLMILENTDNEIIWQINMEVHSYYLENVNEIEKYLQVRNSFLEGLLSNSNFKFERLDKEKFRLTV